MADLKTRFFELTRLPYVDQAVWFLNGFWKEEGEKEAEQIWKYAQKMIELDPKKKAGNELDEFWSHKFLESIGETLTVIALREKLRKIDMDVNGKVALAEYLCFRYGKSVEQLVNAPQGDTTKVDEASSKLNAVLEALAEVEKQLHQQELALQEQKKSEAEAKAGAQAAKKAADEAHASAEEAKQKEAKAKKGAEDARKGAEEAQKALQAQKEAEDAVRKSEEELKAAIADLQKQEDAFKAQIASLEQKSKEGTIVAKNKAAAELAQLKQEDPMPLRKAKLTQEAILRKVEKERKVAESATDVALGAANRAESLKNEAEKLAQQSAAAAREAEADAQAAAESAKQAAALAAEAEEKRLALEEQKKKVEAAKDEALERVKEAEAALEEAKKNIGSPFGKLWWIERELTEAKKYLPKSKQ